MNVLALNSVYNETTNALFAMALLGTLWSEISAFPKYQHFTGGP
jgi:hypothetical protein